MTWRTDLVMLGVQPIQLNETEWIIDLRKFLRYGEQLTPLKALTAIAEQHNMRFQITGDWAFGLWSEKQ